MTIPPPLAADLAPLRQQAHGLRDAGRVDHARCISGHEWEGARYETERAEIHVWPTPLAQRPRMGGANFVQRRRCVDCGHPVTHICKAVLT